MVVSNTKMYRKIKKKGLLSIEKNIMKWGNRFIVVITNYCFKKYWLRKFF